MSAKKRLLRELRELQSRPIENVSAEPLEENIFEWHANVAPFDKELSQVPFHLKIVFSEDYPNRAPKVKVCSYISHPNVFGEYLCLDILTMSEETIGSPYRGWSKAYTVSSLLVQLQSFLFDIESGYLTVRSRKRMWDKAMSYSCLCGHTGRDPFPKICKIVTSEPPKPGTYTTLRDAICRVGIEKTSKCLGILPSGYTLQAIAFRGNRARFCCPDFKDFQKGWCSWITAKGPLLRFVGKKTNSFAQKKEETIVVNKANLSASGTLFDELHEVLARELFEFLDFDTLAAVRSINPEYRKIIDHSRGIQEKNFRCFYTLQDIHSDRLERKAAQQEGVGTARRPLILGVGVTPFIMPRRNRKTGRKKDCMQQLHPSFDLLSYTAFSKHKVRHTVWKDAEFDSFLPLFINNRHGRHALPLAEKMILQMHKKYDLRVEFSPALALTTLAKLMNTTVVDMSKKLDDLGVGEIQLFDSIKVLEGYMSFYHLLLAFVDKYPCIVDIANQRVGAFTSDKKNRDKDKCPDIGELLVYVAISKYEWEEVCPWYIDEMMIRNARWILGKYPNLRNHQEKNLTSCIRMQQSYDATEVGKRMAMFQVFFIDNIACPRHLKSTPDRSFFLLKEMSQRFGKPSTDLAEQLQIHSRKVLACKGWEEYFKMLRFPTPSAQKLSRWLRLARFESKKRRYHDLQRNCLGHYNEPNWKEQPDYDLHLDHLNCCCAGGKIFKLGSKPQSAEQIMKPKDRIDIVFCVDCTGSMGSWLQQAKSSIQSIIKETASKTKAKRVRFGIVGYKDHGDKETTKVTGLTTNVQTIQKAVDALRAGGGADGPEAVGTALAEVHKMTWDKDAVQIAILVTDAPPHGLGDAFHDDYPDGDPNGNDPIKITRTMAQRGIRLYVVDCGYAKGERQCFYHGLATMGNGLCLQLQNSKELSKIMVSSALEEKKHG
jgi:ubiquitin-protein ligase/Mg-chelatase subunit ChlD